VRGYGTVQVCRVLFEAPLPLVIALNSSQGLGDLLDELRVVLVVGFHGFEQDPGVVIGHMLLACACGCVMVLVHSESVHHHMVTLQKLIYGFLGGSLIYELERVEVAGANLVVRGPSDVLFVIGSASEVARPHAHVRVSVGEEVIILGRPLNVLVVESICELGGSRVEESDIIVFIVEVLNELIH